MRQLRINKLPGFTLLETLLTLIILIIFLNVSPYIYKTNHLNLFESRLKINNIIAQFEYLKSKAIAESQSITIVLNKNASEIKVIEQNGKKYTLSLFGAKITSVVKVQTLTFNNEGKINHFGSIILKYKAHIYRIIFHIDKGRIRFVKLSS
ncbi:competence type IV pilus minor pilin ComGD [Staphylococcus borealis]|uniref:competence type IV pilus minor pilin ComGD n=1 Tax=Staphylococcus borealis TaxID=2742203 RepID=UPI00374EB82A|nr:competence type IV pilus minor pilin ComGD [Staphylococcus borealis]